MLWRLLPGCLHITHHRPPRSRLIHRPHHSRAFLSKIPRLGIIGVVILAIAPRWRCSLRCAPAAGDPEKIPAGVQSDPTVYDRGRYEVSCMRMATKDLREAERPRDAEALTIGDIGGVTGQAKDRVE